MPHARIFIQGALSIALLYLHSIGDLLRNAAGVLIVFSARVAVGLLLALTRPSSERPRRGALIAAGIYAASSIWMLCTAVQIESGLLIWLAILCAVALGSYLLAVLRREIRASSASA